MHFKDKLKNYANLLISYGLNVQPGQVVNITAEVYHREFLQLLLEAAYKKGAKYVNIDFIDPMFTKMRAEFSADEEYLKYVPKYIPMKYEEFVDEGAAVLRLCGSEFPDALASISSKKTNLIQGSIRQSLKKYYSEGVSKCKVQWTVASAATPAWGKKVFPELNENAAYLALWEEIFKICRCDKPDVIELWRKHNSDLKKRAKALTEMQIKMLHFSGPGTNLKVYLSPKALFKAGGSSTPQVIDFEANIPTEECFTTPDCRLTEGEVTVTRPVMVNGQLVVGLKIKFHQGKVVDFSAQKGEDTFSEYIQNDPGASRLGEVALVGIDSPVYKSGRVFEEILFDENAACHIAIGSAYKFCIDGGAEMSQQQLDSIGCNDSNVHTDFMISSEEVHVEAETYSGQKIQLIKNGKWEVLI